MRFGPPGRFPEGFEPFVQAGVADSGQEPVGCFEVLFEDLQDEVGYRDTNQGAGLVIADDQVRGFFQFFKMRSLQGQQVGYAQAGKAARQEDLPGFLQWGSKPGLKCLVVQECANAVDGYHKDGYLFLSHIEQAGNRPQLPAVRFFKVMKEGLEVLEVKPQVVVRLHAMTAQEVGKPPDEAAPSGARLLGLS